MYNSESHTRSCMRWIPINLDFTLGCDIVIVLKLLSIGLLLQFSISPSRKVIQWIVQSIHKATGTVLQIGFVERANSIIHTVCGRVPAIYIATDREIINIAIPTEIVMLRITAH